MTPTDDPLLRWLPSLERARAALGSPRADGGIFHRDTDLWSLAPSSQQQRAAVLVVGRTLVRERWQKRMEFSRKALGRLREEPAPSDASAMRTATYRRLVALDAREGVCTNCSSTPGETGRASCLICGGSGWLRPSDGQDAPERPCRDCTHGWTTCSICDGLGRTQSATVEYLNDAVVQGLRTCLPAVPEGLRDGLAESLREASETLAPGLRIDPEGLRSNDPYRGAITSREPDFQGFSYDGAFDAARGAIGELREAQGAFRVEAQAWARPLLLLQYSVRGHAWDVVVWAHDANTLRLLSARAT